MEKLTTILYIFKRKNTNNSKGIIDYIGLSTLVLMEFLKILKQSIKKINKIDISSLECDPRLHMQIWDYNAYPLFGPQISTSLKLLFGLYFALQI